jgi:hypothetical protein
MPNRLPDLKKTGTIAVRDLAAAAQTDKVSANCNRLFCNKQFVGCCMMNLVHFARKSADNSLPDLA